MKKIIAFLLFLFFFSAAFAQQIYYAAAKAGLSIREQPNTNAKVLDKIPYGEKLTIVPNNDQQVAISTEGFNGYWWKIKYKDKIGYVVSSYVLPAPAPKAGTKTVGDYFAQLSTKTGVPLVIRQYDADLAETGGSKLTKNFYKNGMEWHNSEGYEYGSDLYILPGFTIEQCFLLIRLIGQYPDLIGEKDVFPAKKSTVKIDNGEKAIELEREFYDGKPGPLKKIKIISTQGVVTEFEIFTLDTQAVIFWSSGV